VQRHTRTISLGTGLSRFADHSICSSEAVYLARECPLQTVSDRAIGHVAGTTLGLRTTNRPTPGVRLRRPTPSTFVARPAG
jgi:hypothetical protein